MPYPVAAARGHATNSPPWTPAALGAALMLWLEAAPGYLLDGSNQPVVNGGNVTKWIDRRDTAGGQSHPVATATAGGIVWNAASKSVVFDGTNYFNLSSIIALGSSSHTLYVAGTTLGSTAALEATGNVGQDSSGFESKVGNVSYRDSSGNGAAATNETFSAGLMRAVRDIGSGVNITASGGLQSTPDAVGADFNLGTIGAADFSGTHVTEAGATIVAILAVAQDTLAAGTDAAIRQYLLIQFGANYGLP